MANGDWYGKEILPVPTTKKAFDYVCLFVFRPDVDTVERWSLHLIAFIPNKNWPLYF